MLVRFWLSKKMILTESGLSKFEHYGHIDVFRMPPNHIGEIHSENREQKLISVL